jgi:hypothetical protein
VVGTVTCEDRLGNLIVTSPPGIRFVHFSTLSTFGAVCGLLDTHEAYCFNYGVATSLAAPVGVTFKQVDSCPESNWVCGLRLNDSSIVCWGPGAPTVLPTKAWQFISVCAPSIAAIAVDGSVWTWNDNGISSAGFSFNSHNITCSSDLCCSWLCSMTSAAPSAVRLSGPFSFVGVSNSGLCAIRSADRSVQCTAFGGAPFPGYRAATLAMSVTTGQNMPSVSIVEETDGRIIVYESAPGVNGKLDMDFYAQFLRVSIQVDAGSGSDASCAQNLSVPCATIAGGLAACSTPNCFISIAPGSYVAPNLLLTHSSLTLSAVTAGTVAVDCMGAASCFASLVGAEGLTLSGLTLTNCTGAAVSVQFGALSISQCSFVPPLATAISKGDYGGVIVDSCVIRNCTASPIIIRDSALQISHTSIVGTLGTATYGAVDFQSSIAEQGVVLDDFNVTDCRSVCGAVTLLSAVTVSVSRSFFTSAVSGYTGGAALTMLPSAGSRSVSISSSVFRSNQNGGLGSMGGAVSLTCADCSLSFTITDSIFDGNSAQANGGGLYCLVRLCLVTPVVLLMPACLCIDGSLSVSVACRCNWYVKDLP